MSALLVHQAAVRHSETSLVMRQDLVQCFLSAQSSSRRVAIVVQAAIQRDETDPLLLQRTNTFAPGTACIPLRRLLSFCLIGTTYCLGLRSRRCAGLSAGKRARQSCCTDGVCHSGYGSRRRYAWLLMSPMTGLLLTTCFAHSV